MKMAQRFLSSVRLGKSLLLTRSPPLGSLHIQVTHFSHHPYSFLSHLNTCNNHDFHKSHHQKLYFSSSPTLEPDSIVELINTKNWCKELENELEEFHPTLSYETVMYVLKSLQKTPRKALAFFNWVYDKHGIKPSSMAYSLMLRILSNKQTLGDFAAFTKRLEEEGCCVDYRTNLTVMRKLTTEPKKIMRAANDWTRIYEQMNKKGARDDIVKNVVRVIRESNSMGDMEKKLGELEVILSEDFILRTFWAFKKLPLKALCFFHWLKDNMGYMHNAVTYNAIIGILAQKESIEEFWSMVEEMKTAGHYIDIDTYEKVIHRLQRIEMLKEAVKLHELMMVGPYKHLVQDCSPFLGDISLTVKKYEAIEKVISKESYDQIYKSLVAVHKFDEAEKVLKNMRDAGYEPDGVTYSWGVLHLCKAGRMEDSMNLLDEVESKGYALHPNALNILIQAHCKAGEIDQALQCFTRILEMNSNVGNRPLEDLVDCLCYNGRVDDADSVVTEVVDKHNARPFLITFQKLIQQLLREKKLEKATSLLRLMKNHNYPTPRGLYVEYISKFGTIDDAMELLKELSINDNASINSYSCVFESFLKEGRVSEARELLDKSPEHIRKQKTILKLFNKGKEPQHLIRKQVSIVELFSSK